MERSIFVGMGEPWVLWGGSYIVLSIVLCLCGVILGQCISKAYKGTIIRRCLNSEQQRKS